MLLIIKKKATPDEIKKMSGDFDEKATIKRYWPQEDKVELRPRNPKKKPIVATNDQVDIRGKFIGLIRKGE